MAHRPPADAVVALRSLDRRFRALFAGREEDESPDDLARRRGAAGRSAADHVAHATRTLTEGEASLSAVLTRDDAVVEARSTDLDAPPGPVDGLLDELAAAAEALANRADRVDAQDWARTATTPAGTETALEVLWLTVDTVIADLRAAELVLREVRGKP
jgi:hypothetical protein